MKIKTYDCRTLGVRVLGPPAALQRVGKYFRGLAAPAAVQISLDRLTAGALESAITGAQQHTDTGIVWGHPELKYQRFSEVSGKKHLIPKSGPPYLISITPGQEPHFEIQASNVDELGRAAVRVMRQLMLRHAESVGGLLGHGASLVVDGKGIALAGTPGAGKTTVTLEIAANTPKSRLVASDRLVFVPHADGSWKAEELPVPWRIAEGTINSNPRLLSAFAAQPRLYRGGQLVGGKHELITSEMAKMVGAAHSFAATLGRIVVLDRQEGRFEIRDVSTSAEKEALLKATLFNPDDLLFVTDWFGLYPLPSDEEREKRLVRLAGSVRITHAIWSDYPDLKKIAAQLGG